MSNQFILTNKSVIEKKEIPSKEEQQKNDLKFLYQITGKDFKLSNLKKDIGIFLELTDYIFNDIRSISEAGKGVKNMEYNSKQKMNIESLYYNKVKCFNNNVELFQKKLEFIKEQNNGYKNVFAFIKNIKYVGFFLDENLDINENDMIMDLMQFTIKHKWINNFEELINLKNKHFRIINDEKGKFKLISDFYDYYNSKYELNFDIEVKINNNQCVHISNSLFKIIIRNNIEQYMNNIDNNIKEMMSFYIKYLLYKYFKEETIIMQKHLKIESKNSEFLNKGINFTIKKQINKIILKCNYFDNIDITFFIWKVKKNEYKEIDSNFLYSFNKEQKRIYFKDFNDFEKKHNNILIIKTIVKFIKIFLSNILFDIKISKNITNFVGEVKKNNNLTSDNVIKNSIFIKNITNLGLILLKDLLFSTLLSYNNYFLTSNHLNIFETPLGKFRIYYEYFEKGMKLSYIIELYFDNDLNLTIYFKEPYKNLIFNLDQGQGIYIEKGRINFNYIIDVITSCVSNLEMEKNKIKYSFRNTII